STWKKARNIRLRRSWVKGLRVCSSISRKRGRDAGNREESGNWTKAHLKSEIRNFKLDTQWRGAIAQDGPRSRQFNLQFLISDLRWALVQFPNSPNKSGEEATRLTGSLGLPS